MKIILTGSVAYDYLMSFPGRFREHILLDKLETISLSFLVDSMVRLRGGVAPNIAYTLALLGEHPMLWATVGEDFAEYRHWLERMGVDTSGVRVIPGVYTASFFANTDRFIMDIFKGYICYSNFTGRNVYPIIPCILEMTIQKKAIRKICIECI